MKRLTQHAMLAFSLAGLVLAGPPGAVLAWEPSAQQQAGLVITLFVDAGAQGYTGVYLRTQPSRQATIILLVPNGASIRVTPPSVRGTDGEHWYWAAYRGKTGYVRARFLSRRRPVRLEVTGRITEYALPGPCRGPQCDPVSITAGADGNLWFTDFYGGKIGRITPTGRIKEFLLPRFSQPSSITLGSDGNVWFGDISGKVGRMTPNGLLVEFPLPISGSCAFDITSGPDGNLWFTLRAVCGEGAGSTAYAGEKIGRISPKGTVTLFAIPDTYGMPTGITHGPDGNLWFTLWKSGTGPTQSGIGRITPGGHVVEFPLPPSQSSPFAITAGPGGNLWFTEGEANKIGRITPSGRVSEFALPSHGGETGITTGPDGNVWFSEGEANKIGRITPGGDITEFALPTTCGSRLVGACDPSGIARGPDGNLWFTERGGQRIGRLVP